MQTLDIVVEKRLRNSPVFDVRFSPDGTLLAVASKGFVDIYSVSNYERKVCQHISQYILDHGCSALLKVQLMLWFITSIGV